MSSILTALKKVEDESPYRGDKYFRPRYSNRRKLSFHLPIYILIGSVIVILLAGGWVFSNRLSFFNQDHSENGIVSVADDPILPTIREKALLPALSKSVMKSSGRASIPPISSARTETFNAESIPPQQTASHRPDTMEIIRPSPKQWIDNSRLQLQAIAWSNDPERRIAVINDRIIKEGFLIDGIRVVHIKKEAVVVQEGADTFIINFKLR